MSLFLGSALSHITPPPESWERVRGRLLKVSLTNDKASPRLVFNIEELDFAPWLPVTREEASDLLPLLRDLIGNANLVEWTISPQTHELHRQYRIVPPGAAPGDEACVIS